MNPRARRDRLIVRELPDETLVYDLARHKAHCLNRTAALVWRSCDGQTPVAQIAKALRKDLKHTVSEDLVWVALDRLEKARLLEVHGKRSTRGGIVSRREMAKRVALAVGLLLPTVTSLMVPTAAHAATPCRPGAPGCRPNGSECSSSRQCCSCCCNRSGRSFVCSMGSGCI